MAFVFPWKEDWGTVDAFFFFVENMKFEKPRRRSEGRKDAPCSGDRSSGALTEENIEKSDQEY